MDGTEGSQPESTQAEGVLGNLRPRSEAVKKITEERRKAIDSGELVESPEEQRARHLRESKPAVTTPKPQNQRVQPQRSYAEKLASIRELTKTPESQQDLVLKDVFIYEPHTKTTGSVTRAGRVSGRYPSGEALLEKLVIPASDDEMGKKIAFEVEVPIGWAYYAPYQGSSLDLRVAEANLKRAGLPYINKPMFVTHIPGQKDEIQTRGYEIISVKERLEEHKQELPKAA
jgi:hypothetical protein